MEENKCSCGYSSDETTRCKMHQKNEDEIRWVHNTAHSSQDTDEITTENLDRD